MDELRQTKSTEVTPNSNYKDKYIHLIGQEAAEKAAKRTETNKSYGFGKYFDAVFEKETNQTTNIVNGFHCVFFFSSERE